MGLDIVELVLDVENAFGGRISDADAKNLTTVGALYDYVGRQVAPDLISPRGGPYAGELWERYLDVFVESTGVRRDRRRPEARFVQDLGLE